MEFQELEISGFQLLRVSKAIHQGVWDIVFQNTNFAIGFQVSNKAVHVSDPHTSCFILLLLGKTLLF
jgi:hypothetical protein